MKELKQFVASELFRCQKKTSDLYQEFTRVKSLKDEMNLLGQQ